MLFRYIRPTLTYRLGGFYKLNTVGCDAQGGSDYCFALNQKHFEFITAITHGLLYSFFSTKLTNKTLIGMLYCI